MSSDFYNNSIFWIEVNRIQPNPFQPRKEFDSDSMQSLADSIRQYGVLQPLVVTRRELEMGDGGISVEYELVAGERRLRASKLAGLSQVPVLIRSSEDTDKMKLEMAIIENLQREDLNPVDRALAFKQLVDSFNLKHVEIAKKVGKSREYVSNSLRILALPETMQIALVGKQINEGHTRPLLMLTNRPEQQQKLFDEIVERRINVREAEHIARSIAVERARKHELPPDLATLERTLAEKLGTRVQIETRKTGGRLHIDFFSDKDIQFLLSKLSQETTLTNNGEKYTSNSRKDSSETGLQKDSVINTSDKSVSPSNGNVVMSTPVILSPLALFVSQANIQQDDTNRCNEGESRLNEQEMMQETSEPNIDDVNKTEQDAQALEDEKAQEEENLYSINTFAI